MIELENLVVKVSARDTILPLVLSIYSPKTFAIFLYLIELTLFEQFVPFGCALTVINGFYQFIHFVLLVEMCPSLQIWLVLVEFASTIFQKQLNRRCFQFLNPTFILCIFIIK